MADLTSSSTFADIVAAWDTNALYDIDGDSAKARLFIQAGRFLLIKLPRRAAKGGEEQEFDPKIVEKAIQTAVDWLARKNSITTNPRVRQLSGRNWNR